MSKDVIVVASCAAMFKNWEYVVLSRVRTLSGLYLIEPIDTDKSFKPSSELKKYFEHAKRKEKEMLEKRKKAIAQLNWI
jgi:hypothetical protein